MNNDKPLTVNEYLTIARTEVADPPVVEYLAKAGKWRVPAEHLLFARTLIYGLPLPKATKDVLFVVMSYIAQTAFFMGHAQRELKENQRDMAFVMSGDHHVSLS